MAEEQNLKPPERAPMVILTPGDVAKLMQCTRRRAFQYMRAAGALPQGKDDLRISRERFERWVNETNFQPPPVARGPGRRLIESYPLTRSIDKHPLREGLPLVRPTQPRKRKVPKT